MASNSFLDSITDYIPHSETINRESSTSITDLTVPEQVAASLNGKFNSTSQNPGFFKKSASESRSTTSSITLRETPVSSKSIYKKTENICLDKAYQSKICMPTCQEPESTRRPKLTVPTTYKPFRYGINSVLGP